jgi:hypothetical protein
MHCKVAIALGALAVTLAATAARAQDEAPQAQFAAIVAEYDKAQQEFGKLYFAAKTDEERQKLFTDKYPKPDGFAARLVALAAKFPKDPVAVDSLVWVLQNRHDAAANDPLLMTLQDHLDSAKLADACTALEYGPSPGAEPFLRLVLEKSPHKDVQGNACYVLAKVVSGQAGLVRTIQAGEKEQLTHLERFHGKATMERLAKADPEQLDKQAEQLLERVAEQFADVKGGRSTLGEAAKGDLFELRNLAVGKTAPDIVGEDVDGVPFKLSDYRGKVVFLDFWGFW